MEQQKKKHMTIIVKQRSSFYCGCYSLQPSDLPSYINVVTCNVQCPSFCETERKDIGEGGDIE